MSAIEDLSRFPSESLHSFSFTHQSEDSLHNRQNVLKRSMDFMRDKLGWAASNPGLIAAQARLTGDQEVQSMLELLARAQLIGEGSHQAHGLGAPAPLTGPADISNNVFEQSFGMSRSESPELAHSPLQRPQGADHIINALARRAEETTEIKGETTLDSMSKAIADEYSESAAAPQRPRAVLKRTLTNTDEISLHRQLTDTLAKPYSVHEELRDDNAHMPNHFTNTPSSRHSSAMTGPAGHITPSNTAPHGHSNRLAPVAQAIFTTEAHAPWTITAANDLACLVFGVTGAEVRKLGILEVVKEERRKWLEDKLRDPEAGSLRKSSSSYTHSQRSSPNPTTNMNLGSGITARLLSKPPSRVTAASKRRAQTDDGAGSSKLKPNGRTNHAPHKSRGVLLCGDVVPILKRNGTLGSASLWVKEKKAGLIWVMEEIAEDIAHIHVDEVGCVVKFQGATDQIWGSARIPQGMDIKRLIPAIPRIAGTNTGALDFSSIRDVRTYTARTSNDMSIPVTVEMLSENTVFRVSSFPHIAGIMVLNSKSLCITSSNTVFSGALFGQNQPDNLHINEIIPGFDSILQLISDEDNVRLVDGIVIPEHSFRRARALLAISNGTPDAAAVFSRPSGLPARHRDGSEILVDIQMRVVKSERSHVDEHVIEEVEEDASLEISHFSTTEVVYALWITYSRHLHAIYRPEANLPTQPSRMPSPCMQAVPDPSDVGEMTPFEGLGISTTPTSQQNSGSDETTPQEDLLSRQITAESYFADDGSPRRKAISDFVVLEDMGQGAYGQVKLVRYKASHGRKMVIKYVTKRRILVDTWTRDRRLGTVPLEIHVLDYLRRDGLKHPNIVEMVDFFEDDVNYYIEMVPHGTPGMDLFDYIEMRTDMTENEGRKIFVQVAQAVWHLHIKAKVVHRDIKDENVILNGNDGNIKLIDFGSAAYIKSGPFDVFVGTIGESIHYFFVLFSTTKEILLI